MTRFGSIEPCRSWRIFNPWMVRTCVVHHLVLNDLYARAMRGVHEFAQLLMRTEVFLDGVEILRIVAMKSGTRFFFLQLDLIQTIVVVVPGRQPDRRHAEFF